MKNKILKSLLVLTLIFSLIVPINNSFTTTTPQRDPIYVISDAKVLFSKDDTSVRFKERAEAVNISKENVSNLSTTNLLELIMEYPFLGNIFAYDDCNTGLDSLINIFEPLNVFIDRPDAVSVLEAKYTRIKESDDKFIERTFLETLGNRIGYKYTDKGYTARAVTTYVTTPKGSKVEVFIRGEELTARQKAEINNYYDKKFPFAKRLSGATTNYNCHSYAWHNQSTSNIYWMNKPTTYYTDGSYSLSSTSSGSTGDKATYMPHNTIIAIPEHSAIVSGSLFISKWGQAGLYRHSPKDSPYDSDYIYYFN
ncbi:hypothetical protein PV797_19130 [Clostridiaceae bacterium M8S5]|nr:hypothetical protein PV797_19130 [Clostridiaceae bacterium M8S5]